MKWQAPEKLNEEGITEKIDVWCVGYVLYQMITQKVPYQGMHDEEAEAQIMKGVPPMVDSVKILNSTDPCLKAVLKAMRMTFVFDPNARPAMREVAHVLESAPSECVKQ